MTMESSSGSDLDRLLERELQQRVAAHPGSFADPGMARYHAAFLTGGMHMPFVPSFLAGLSAKAAVGLAVATLAVGGGATVAVATTHSINPIVWGETVVGAVKTCKAEYGPSATPSGSTTAKENVGQCVSAIAKTHGQMERQLHAGGKGANPNAHAGGRPNGVPGGASTGQHGGSHAPKFAGKPKGLPTQPTKGRPNGTPSGH
ncbi:MAG: hypothetical protein ACYCYK_10720 [Candidatus Dormibacteria bacterium]